MAETVRIEIPIETIDNTDPELSGITIKFDRMKKAAENANDAAKKSNTTVTQFDKQARKTEKSLANWAKEKYEIMLEAKDKITPILSTLGNGLRGLAGKTWSVTMRAIDLVTSPVRGIINLLKNPVFQVGAVLGVSIGLKDTIETYKDFEAAMSQVQAISGATGYEVDKLTSKAKEMGATTKFTAEESAEAFNYMAMAGWKTEDMLNGIEGILSLAAASGEDLATTSDIVTDALTAFNMNASDAGRFSDVLAAAASNANTSVSGMGETFKYAGSMAGALGYSIEDVALMTGLMANTGIKATMAGTALNSIFTRLSTNTGGAADALKDLEISFFTSEGNARDLSDVMGELRKATAGMSAEQKSQLANTIAGTEAQKGLLAILNASETDYNKLADAINNADGAAGRMSETMLDNLQGSITLLQSAVDGAKVSLGERLSPYVRSLATWLTDQMPEVEQGLDELMDWVDTKAERMKWKFDEISETDEWKNADFFGKAGIAWDEFIAKPFSEWWNGTGKARFAEFSQDIGEGIGAGLKMGVMTLLGIDLGETLDEGASIGASFAKGFSEGFDFDTVSGTLWGGFKNLLSSAGKLLPGGESADLSSIMSVVMLGKIGTPFVNMGKGAFDIGKALFGKGESGTSLAGSFGSWLMGSAAKGTGLKGLGATMGMTGLNLGSGAATGAGLIAAGTAATVGGVAAGATLVSGALDAYRAIKSDDKAESKAYGESAAWKVGGVAAGAAAGAALGSIIPGLGTAVGALIGAGVGGIAGWIKGNKVKEEYQENVEEMQKEAEKAQKVFEATGFSIDDVTFETKALNDAINDTEVSAQELGVMFQEAVTDKLNSRFGDLKLSLKEIKEIASDIVFDKYVDSINAFSSATTESESALSAFKGRVQSLDKLNWKVGLGMKLSEDDIDEYRTAIDEFVESAKTYVENKHYEATVALKLLLGEDGPDYTGRLNETYANLQSQIEALGGQLTARLNVALEDGVITLDEQAEITSIQQQITDITNKVAQAEADAQFSAIKIRYGGAALDAESFAGLQAELKTSMESMTQSYDQALEVSLTNLNLQLSEGAITEEEYNAQLQQIADGYNAQIEGLQVRVESFQLEAIADAFGTELDGILPEIEGTTAEKLKEAMDAALAIEPDPVNWTAEDIAEWFGLEALSGETQMAVAELLQATAETIPQNMRDEIVSAMSATDMSDVYSGVDFVGPLSNEYYEQMATVDLSAGAVALATNLETVLPSQFMALNYSPVGTEVSNGVGDAIRNADMEEINSAANTLKNNTDTYINTAFNAGVSTTMPVNVMLDYNVVNPTKTFTINGEGASGSASITVTAHAGGGYVSGGPQLSWLAEEGYGEYVIPTNPSRRTRALELYEQAGAALGITTHADGGYIHGSKPGGNRIGNHLSKDANTNVPTTYNEPGDGGMEVPLYDAFSTDVQAGPTIQVNVNMTPEFVVSAGGEQTEEDVMQVIRRHMKEMADELGGEIAGMLEEVFSNMPLKEA